MKKYLSFFISLLFATTVFAQQAFPPRTQKLQDAQSTGNGVELNTTGYSVLTLEIVGSEAGTDRVVTFEAWQDTTAGFVAVQCANQGTRAVGTTLTTSGTTAYHVQCDVAGFNRFRTPLSGGATGNVTVTATAISNSSSGIVAAVMTPAAGAAPTDVNVEQWNNQTVAGGAGAVAAGTPRVTLASDDPAVVALQIIDDWDENDRGKVNIIVGQAGITGGSGVVAANTPRVVLATDVALPAGTNNIGDVDVLSVIPGTAATNLGKAEDAGHTTGDVGVVALAVRNDVRGTLAGTDLDYSPFQVNSSGDVRVDGSAVTQPVSGPLTDTQLRATAVPVSGPLTDTQLRATAVPVSGPLTDTQLRATPVPVSGTVTANQGTNNATPWNENIAQINGVTPLMGNGITGTGSQRVTVASDNTPFPVKIDQTTPGTTNRVDVGTFPDNEPFNIAQINGVTPLMGNGVTGTGSQRVTIASDNTAFTVNIGTFPDNEPINVAQIAGTATSTGNGVVGAGVQRVAIASDNTAFSVNVGTFPDNEPFNVAQFGGSAVVTGTGVGGAGIPRVTISSDSSLAANQSVNTAQINGVAPTMGNGVSGTGVQRVTIASDSTGQVALATGSATIGALTANQSVNVNQIGARAVGDAFTFLASTSHTATTVLAAVTDMGGFNHLLVTWDVTAAERDSADETYDLYVTCSDGVSTWDVVHFPQIITTGAKRYTAAINGTLLPQEVTTATPGVSANASGTFKTDTSGAGEGTRTLAAGKVRHGMLGDRCGADIVIAGTIVTGITHSITMTVRP